MSEHSTALAVSRPTMARCPEMFYDQIVLWRDVQSGDLVILNDELVVAVQVDVIQKPWGDGTTFPAVDIRHQLDNGCFVVNERHGNSLTAVRRPKGAVYSDHPGHKAEWKSRESKGEN